MEAQKTNILALAKFLADAGVRLDLLRDSYLSTEHDVDNDVNESESTATPDSVFGSESEAQCMWESESSALCRPCVPAAEAQPLIDDRENSQDGKTAKIHISIDAFLRKESKSEYHVISEGTRGHPKSCGVPCKFAFKSGGCRNGEKCSYCHACKWNPNGKNGLKNLNNAAARETPPFHDSGPQAQVQPFQAAEPTTFAAKTVPSVGSLGHPFSCSAPCKYFAKRNGCKDGAACERCHLCKWFCKAGKKTTKVSTDPSAGVLSLVQETSNSPMYVLRH